MQLDFQNRYGRLTLKLVSDVRPVKGIRGVDIDDCHKFDMDTAEKIALITDNRGIQLCYGAGARLYVVAHDTPSTCAVARIETMSYVGQNPAQEIRDARRLDGHEANL